MNKRRYIIEMGTGVEQHGQDVTEAAVKAVKDTISRVCLIGLIEMIERNDRDDTLLDILISCPYPERVNTDKVLQALPFGKKAIKVVEGGMIVRGHNALDMGDKTDEIIVANAAVTVSVDLDTITLRTTK
ncbi:MAG: Lin0512 family protein [Dehalococcoidales bacterium]|nr:Lin0512 family protein [Dehalococcoidales bacterium]